MSEQYYFCLVCWGFVFYSLFYTSQFVSPPNLPRTFPGAPGPTATAMALKVPAPPPGPWAGNSRLYNVFDCSTKAVFNRSWMFNVVLMIPGPLMQRVQNASTRWMPRERFGIHCQRPREQNQIRRWFEPRNIFCEYSVSDNNRGERTLLAAGKSHLPQEAPGN